MTDWTPDAPSEPTEQTPDTTATATAEQPSLRQRYRDWPQKGDEDRAQPWDLDALNVPKSDRELDDGARDTVSPVVIRHAYPVLASGAASPAVAELGRRLADLGYDNSVSEGANPFNVVDDSVLSAVDRFRSDYGVQEDPTPYGGTNTAAQLRAALHIGPYTWEAVLRASDRIDEDDS
jgi:peptidoglycan hydrolase-like protein with peptidoglycan-binding domain